MCSIDTYNYSLSSSSLSSSNIIKFISSNIIWYEKRNYNEEKYSLSKITDIIKFYNDYVSENKIDININIFQEHVEYHVEIYK